jgi:hypothetical protein
MSAFDPKRTFDPEIVAAQNDGRTPFRRSEIPAVIASHIAVVPALGKAMRRRDFIKAIAGSATSWPVAARAQQSEKMHRIGFLTLLSGPSVSNEGLQRGLIPTWLRGRAEPHHPLSVGSRKKRSARRFGQGTVAAEGCLPRRVPKQSWPYVASTKRFPSS